MKTFKTYIAALAAALAITAGTSACQDHFDEPDMGVAPEATWEANTTIRELKEMLWKADNNYCDQVYTKEWYAAKPEDRTEAMKTEGTHVVIKGRVCSSDYAGNVFKFIVLQDEDGYSLNFSINSYNLYMTNRVGQEIVVDLTGLYAGKYRGLFQVGFPSFNSGIPGYETSFLAPELYTAHRQLDGFPDAAKVDTTVVNSFAELGTSTADLQKWQSRVVRFKNVSFVPNAETPTLSTYHENVTQQIRDAAGNTMDIRTSGYCNFWDMVMPEGTGDIVAICGYYMSLANTGGYQLTLIDRNSIIGFGTELGTKDNPYSVADAIAGIQSGATTRGWVRGYIVGAVAPEVETVTSNADIQFTQTPDLANTIVIGATPETTDYTQCLVVQLTQDTDLRKYGPLRDNPGNYKKQIDILGNFATVMGTFGLNGNNGSSSEYVIEGLTPPTPPTPGTDVVLLADKDANGFNGWTTQNVLLHTGVTNVWSWDTQYFYLKGTSFQKDNLGDSEAYAISPVIDLTGVTAATAKFDHAARFQTTLKELCKFMVREQGATDWTALTIPTWPEAGSWTFVSSGDIDLSAWAGKKIQLAYKYGASAAGADTWEIRNLTLTPVGGSITVEGGTTPDQPDQPGKPDQPGDQGGTEGVFNFGDPTSLTPAYSEADQVADGTTGNFKIDVKDVTFTSGSAGIVDTGTGTAPRLYHQPAKDNYADTWTYRCYKNTTLTLMVADGYHITKIDFDPQTSSHKSALAALDWSKTGGTFADNVWTAAGNDVSTINLAITATVGFNKITIHYAK